MDKNNISVNPQQDHLKQLITLVQIRNLYAALNNSTKILLYSTAARVPPHTFSLNQHFVKLSTLTSEMLMAHGKYIPVQTQTILTVVL